MKIEIYLIKNIFQYTRKMLRPILKQYVFNNFKCKFGQKKDGVQLGGDMILKSNIMKRQTLRNNKINTIDIKKYSDYGNGYKTINNGLKKGLINVNFGGDHSIAVSTIQPMLDHYKNDLLVIWIDAHADINTFDSSITKNIHGMPLASLTGLMRHWYKVKNSQFILPTENLLYVGLRDLDKFEETIIKNNKIMYFSSFDKNIISIINNNPAKYIHISCDIDGLDPKFAPSTGTAVNSGLRVKNINKIIKASKERLVGFDLVEFNPLIGSKKDVKKTLLNINKILIALFK
jgi:arginase